MQKAVDVISWNFHGGCDGAKIVDKLIEVPWFFFIYNKFQVQHGCHLPLSVAKKSSAVEFQENILMLLYVCSYWVSKGLLWTPYMEVRFTS